MEKEKLKCNILCNRVNKYQEKCNVNIQGQTGVTAVQLDGINLGSAVHLCH